MAEILLVRHGQTGYNAERIFRGRLDVPLDDHGRRQAGLLAEALAERNLGAIHTSSLSRARETAQPIAARCSLSVEESPALIDMDFGDWQGQPLAQVERRWPDLLRRYHTDPERFRAPGGESLEEVRLRAAAELRRLIDVIGERPIALVSHRVVIKVLLCEALGAGLRAFWRIRQDTAAISALEPGPGRLTVVATNNRCHLRSLGSGDQIDF